MPSPTPTKYLVEMFGEDFIEVVLIGDSFDDAAYAATLDYDVTKSFYSSFQ